VEGLVGPEGVAKRIKELEAEGITEEDKEGTSEEEEKHPMGKKRECPGKKWLSR